MSIRYSASESWFKKVSEVIPLASQTFSKSVTQYPLGAAPLFAARAKGSRLWDVDGNEYVDFVNSLAAILVGYGDEEINAAVRDQLEDGVTFSLSHLLEYEVARELTQLIPNAEQVRFGKNGSDTTSAAIRIARAYTQRDYVATCGYHGWQDWYIGSTTRNLGVPQAVCALTLGFKYNDIDSLKKLFQGHPGQIAAVIMEPMNVQFPKDDFLKKVRELATTNGALLVFDETITGFRFSMHGAGSLFGVVPDLSTFGKGLANGFPLSAITGPKKYMRLFEEIFFSSTFGGETLSLAASRATLQIMKRTNLSAHLKELGDYLESRLNALLPEYELGECMTVSGHQSWLFLNFADRAPLAAFEIKTLFLQECFKRGILTLGTHNLSLAHTRSDIDLLMEVYRGVFELIRTGIKKGSLETLLEVAPLRPLFKVR